MLHKELRELFDNAPIEPEEHGDISKTSDKRRPIEGDCPICYMEFDPDKEKIVWCETCGNNIHEICFNRWAATNQARGVRCVFWYGVFFFNSKPSFVLAPDQTNLTLANETLLLLCLFNDLAERSGPWTI